MIEQLFEEHGFDNWYDWRIEHWGTKWGCYRTHVSDEGDQLFYRFHTAWRPFNSSVLANMAERFPTLAFTLLYGEIGCAFYGSMQASDGKLGVCSSGSLDDVTFYDYDTEQYTWPDHLSEDMIRLLESSG